MSILLARQSKSKSGASLSTLSMQDKRTHTTLLSSRGRQLRRNEVVSKTSLGKEVLLASAQDGGFIGLSTSE